MNKTIRENLTAYTFLAPFLIIFGIFMIYPIFYSLYLSFNSLPDFSTFKWVGLKQYIKLVNDKAFLWSLLMTFYYALISIPLNIAFSLALALLLNNKLPGKSFFRTVYFLPNVLDTLVVGIIWVFIYYPGGPLDKLISFIGIKYFSQTGFLGRPEFSLIMVALAMVLKNAGFGMVLFLAAIQNIPESVYEAADIDGANGFQKFRYITLPLLRPIMVFLIITGVIGALGAFSEIYAMTSGGPTVVLSKTFMGDTPVGVTKVSGYYLYYEFSQLRLGYASAISYALFVITLIISGINLKFIRSD